MPGTIPLMPSRLLAILRCPVTDSPLRLEGETLVAVEDPEHRYPIEAGVPRLLPRTAR